VGISSHREGGYDMLRKECLDSIRHHRRGDYGTGGGGPEARFACHIVDTATHRAAGPVDTALGKPSDQAESGAAWGREESCDFSPQPR